MSAKAVRLLFFFLLTSILLSSASTRSVLGACGFSRHFTSVGAGLEYSYIYTPGFPFPNGLSTTDNFDGVFWSFGGGDPAVGLGNDMGGFGPFEPTGGASQYGGWIYPGGTPGTVFYPTGIYNYGGHANWGDPSRISWK